MTPTLRTYHRNLWSIFTFILIGLFVMACNTSTDKDTEATAETTTKTKVTDSTPKKKLGVAVSIPDDHLEIEINGDLPGPSMLLFASANNKNDIKGDRLLAQINVTGKHRFKLDTATLALPTIYFKGYDPIEKKVVIKAVVK